MSNTIDARSLFAGKEIGKSFRKQNTLIQSVSLTGFGFWTGKDVTIQFRPAPPDSGIVFVRSDFFGQPRIPALVQYREEKPRQTSLVCGIARVDMVEHVLAALSGLQIDNCEIWTDQPEMPGFDGSSQVFLAALEATGIVAQSAKRAVRVVTRAFHIGNKQSYIIVTTNRRGGCEFQYTLIPEANYPIQTQRCQVEVTPESFREELAMTRTFIAKHEADALLAQGLCQRVTPQNVLVLTENGPLENQFLYENECARHKTLDMVGDFALLGCDLVGTFESFRGGHSLNAECVRQLLEKTMLLDTESVGQSSVEQEQDCFRGAA
jgi:UDP-3-O-acyl N-acetylglucosamine deacetylase